MGELIRENFNYHCEPLYHVINPDNLVHSPRAKALFVQGRKHDSFGKQSLVLSYHGGGGELTPFWRVPQTLAVKGPSLSAWTFWNVTT